MSEHDCDGPRCAATCLVAYADERYDDMCDDCYDELSGDGAA